MEPTPEMIASWTEDMGFFMAMSEEARKVLMENMKNPEFV